MIVSRQNRTLKDIRRLRHCKGEAGDRALLEGDHLVAEACKLGLSLETVLTTPGFLDSAAGRRLAPLLPAPPVLVEPGLFGDLCDARSPKGVLAVVRLPRPEVTALPRRPGAPYLYVDGLQDPGNLGALARSLEAAGGGGAALAPGTAHPNHPRALRASAGSLLRLPVAIAAAVADLDRHLAALAPRWLALVPRGGVDLYRAPLEGALVLMVGAEGPGLSPAAEGRADLRVTVPLAPPVESLNAVVAASLVLFEARRQAGAAVARPAATGPAPP